MVSTRTEQQQMAQAMERSKVIELLEYYKDIDGGGEHIQKDYKQYLD